MPVRANADVESAASWRSYKNNRYASLGARRILRTLREHFRTYRHVMRREEDFERYAWQLFEELLEAGAFALLHCGVAEENELAMRERDNRRRRAGGHKPEPLPDEAEAELIAEKERQLERQRLVQAQADADKAVERRERRQMQLSMPWNQRRAAKRAAASEAVRESSRTS